MTTNLNIVAVDYLNNVDAWVYQLILYCVIFVKKNYFIKKRKMIKINNIYIISDTHFGHKNILDYCQRPFKTIEEMDNTIIHNWNSIVDNDDVIYHCGDFAFGSPDEIRNYASLLNGHKILLRGNHDRKGIGFFESCGFEIIRQKYYTLGIIKNGEIFKYVFTHAPMADNLIPDEMINIHGHIHNTELKQDFNKDKHFCVSCECIGYKPIKLN